MTVPSSAELRKLLAKVPDEHWEIGGPYPGTSVIVQTDPGSSWPDPTPPEYEPIAVLDQRIEGEPSQLARDRAALIVAMRNSLSTLLDRLEKAERVCAFAESVDADLCGNADSRVRGGMTRIESGRIDRLCESVAAWLKAVNP